MSEAYLLTISACPIIFTSPGLGTVTDMSVLPTTNDEWPSGHDLTTIANGALDPKYLQDWTEKIDLLNGNLDIDGLTFRIHDILMDYDGAQRNIASYLFTRTDQESCQLGATIEKNETTSFTVRGSYNPIPDAGAHVWINNEAIFIDSISGMTVNISERGWLGTFASKHEIDEGANYFPAIYLDYPGCFKAKVLLWRKDDNGTWSIIWRGVGGRAPRQSGNGAPIELQCEHWYTQFKNDGYKVIEATTNLVGFDTRRTAIRQTERSPARFPLTNIVYYTPYSFSTSVEDVGSNRLIFYRDAFESYYKLYEAPRVSGIGRRKEDDSLAIVENTSFWNYQAFITYGESIATVNIDEISAGLIDVSYRGFTPGNSTVSLPDGSSAVKISLPAGEALHVFRQDTALNVVIDGIQSMDTITFVSSGSVSTCETNTAFIGDIAEETIENQDKVAGFIYGASPHGERQMIVKGGSYDYTRQNDSDTPLYIGLPTVSFRDKEINKYTESRRQFHFVQQEVELAHRVSLKSRHWMDLIRYGIIEPLYNPNDWSFTFADYMAVKLDNPSFTTEFFLEPDNSYGDIVQGLSQFYSIVPVTTTGGKLRFQKLRKPSNTTPSVATLTSADLVEAPSWQTEGDQVITTVVYNSEGLQSGKLVINNRFAQGKYGVCQTVDVDLSKIGIERALFQREAVPLLSAHTQLRFFDFFGEPYLKVSFGVSLEYLDTIYPGMIVTLTEWLLPNGTGSRGLSAAKLLITEKSISLQDGTIRFTGMLFPNDNTSGYSPCIKISAINTGTKTLTIYTTYIDTGRADGPTDYAGSNLSIYTSNSGFSANDGGLAWLNIGDKVELILRNSTTFSTFSLTVASKGSGTLTVSETITTSPVDWPTEAAAGNVDLRFNGYTTSGIQAEQKTWAYLADGDTSLIATVAPAQKLR